MFDLHENELVGGTHFHMNGHGSFRPKTRFATNDTEAQGHSQKCYGLLKRDLPKRSLVVQLA